MCSAHGVWAHPDRSGTAGCHSQQRAHGRPGSCARLTIQDPVGDRGGMWCARWPGRIRLQARTTVDTRVLHRGSVAAMVLLLLFGRPELQYGGPTHLERQRERPRWAARSVAASSSKNRVGVGRQVLSAVYRGPGSARASAASNSARDRCGPMSNLRLLLWCAWLSGAAWLTRKGTQTGFANSVEGHGASTLSLRNLVAIPGPPNWDAARSCRR